MRDQWVVWRGHSSWLVSSGRNTHLNESNHENKQSLQIMQENQRVSNAEHDCGCTK